MSPPCRLRDGAWRCGPRVRVALAHGLSLRPRLVSRPDVTGGANGFCSGPAERGRAGARTPCPPGLLLPADRKSLARGEGHKVGSGLGARGGGPGPHPSHRLSCVALGRRDDWPVPGRDGQARSRRGRRGEGSLTELGWGGQPSRGAQAQGSLGGAVLGPARGHPGRRVLVPAFQPVCAEQPDTGHAAFTWPARGTGFRGHVGKSQVEPEAPAGHTGRRPLARGGGPTPPLPSPRSASPCPAVPVVSGQVPVGDIPGRTAGVHGCRPISAPRAQYGLTPMSVRVRRSLDRGSVRERPCLSLRGLRGDAATFPVTALCASQPLLPPQCGRERVPA